MDATPWWMCDHKGIGLPGCPTCDDRLDETAKTALRDARDELARLHAALATAKDLLREARPCVEADQWSVSVDLLDRIDAALTPEKP
jgi:hypothetical protein